MGCAASQWNQPTGGDVTAVTADTAAQFLRAPVPLPQRFPAHHIGAGSGGGGGGGSFLASFLFIPLSAAYVDAALFILSRSLARRFFTARFRSSFVSHKDDGPSPSRTCTHIV